MMRHEFRGASARAAFSSVLLAPLVGLALVLAGCGGGGYGGMNPPPTMPVAVKHSVSVGAISSFSSSGFSVNGVQFQATAAAVTVDGKSASLDDLHVGDMVEVKGHHDDGNDQDVADEVDLHGNVQGPVSAIDTTAQTLTVLGQTVVVSANTSFEDDIIPASLLGVQVGDILEVSGMPAADGSIQATRIERKPAGSAFAVSGTASATDAIAKTLNINALVVDFSGATLNGFASGGPQDGQLIAVTGTMLEQNGALQATQLQLLTGQDMHEHENDQAKIEGLITRFVSASDFDAAGQAVSTSSSTEFDGGTAADLALNVSVEVEGTVDSNGVIQASKVRIGHPADVRLTAQVDAIDANAGTLTVLGTTVNADANTRFEDHASGRMKTFSLADIQVGDWLEIRGAIAGTGNTSIGAMRIDREQPQSEVRLMGPVVSVAQPVFTVLAATVTTTAQTQFSDGLDLTSFFGTAAGKTVSVQGSWDGSTLTADKVQLGDDHNDDGED
jgi:Domain of unknown function (DUF5666)